MEAFQRIVLLSALGILIVCLVFIGLALSKTKVQQWPPVLAQCPDYWDAQTGSDGQTLCVNSRNLGKSNLEECGMKATKDWSNDCDRYKFATNCGVQWDGITYGMKQPNPCTTTANAPAK